MVIENMEELIKPKLIEDLGRLYPKETSKHKVRFGIYECGFCGTHFKTYTSSVKRGLTKSCGCYHKSQTSNANKVHGGSGTKLYGTWTDIKTRTSNKNIQAYNDYGGRGITVCEEWLNDFVSFRDWALANGYEEDKGLSIDRIDNDKGYSPENCRWTTRTIQVRNQRIKSSNKSGFKGVYFDKNSCNFRVYITINGKKVNLGRFKTAIEGAIAYNTFIIENILEGFILNVIPTK